MSTQEDRLRAGRAVVARIVLDEVKATVDRLRGEIEPTMRPRETITAELPDGTEIGTVGRARPSTRPTVTDSRALLAWVREHRPAEIVESVNPAYVKHLEQTARTYGHAVDSETGEIVPGIEMVTGTASYRVAATDDGRDVVAAQLRQVLGLPALEAGSA